MIIFYQPPYEMRWNIPRMVPLLAGIVFRRDMGNKDPGCQLLANKPATGPGTGRMVLCLI
jgi:hypothetical protein